MQGKIQDKNADNKIIKPNKVLILGSGALKIGEAGEFDYSGSQCIKALKEEGISAVLINPNIATIQTSEHLADKVYFLPVNPYFVEKVIEKEKPDTIYLSFGGQTALNCGVELYNNGILEKYNVKVLGTPVEAIINTEDRELFIDRLNEISVKTARSKAVNSIEEALKVADKIGYPIMTRVAYALGGKGSGFAMNAEQLKHLAEKAFSFAKQILVEEYLHGWKEIEYEVVRDRHDNCITVCNMENFDPMGIHTGESIVVAPSQTLTNNEYHKLREIAIRVVRHLGIIGECNIQYAFDPDSEDYRVIEVNARLSRSSALASKATGYPLAFVAAKLGLGYSLTEIPNSITKKTMACFEPALDYIIVKIPRWDLNKFELVSKKIGSEMKSVGEVMAIGRKFGEALQKGLRMLQVGMYGLVCNNLHFDDIEDELKNPSDQRIFAIAYAMENGYTVEKIHELSRIDKWFLYKIRNIIEMGQHIKETGKLENIEKENLLLAKQLGFSDKQISVLTENHKSKVRKHRRNLGIVPFVKQIDTLAVEYPAQTNYLYLTYNGIESDIEFGSSDSKNSSKNNEEKSVIVLGSGAYRIGSSVEFDWCCVNCVFSLKTMGYKTIMINYNPETVSTDYDICDRLYFDELSFETVSDIYEMENPHGMVISMGGQIPNNLAMKCHKAGMKILGTNPEMIDTAEDRNKFSSLLEKINVDQPEWTESKSFENAKSFSKKVDYPVLIRPSYVLSGSAMNVARDEKELELYLQAAVNISEEYPVVISKFITGAKEIEVDAVAYNGRIAIWAVTEHIENAGVHSGDATMVLPPQKLYIETIRRIKKIAELIASSLKINGPFNIQFLAKNNDVKVIECNLRASRSFPFVSKVIKQNLIDLATKIMVEKETNIPRYSLLDSHYVGIKVPQFSFSRLKGADPILRIEMASTGEVACLGDDLQEALLKSMIAAGTEYPESSMLVSVSGEKNRYEILDNVKKIHEKGYKIYATESTSIFLKNNNVPNTMLYKIHEKKQPNVLDYLMGKKIDLVINIPNEFEKEELDDDYTIRRATVDFSIPLLTNLQIADAFLDSILNKKLEDLEILSWDEYHD